MKPLRIVFFGEDSFSDCVLKSLVRNGYDVVGVVTPEYDNMIYRRLESTCKINSIPFHRIKKINSEHTLQLLREAAPELGVICHFERIVSQKILDIPRYGFINLHPSLLPLYRGLTPQHRPIMAGDSMTGITVHRVDATADTGDIIVQKEIELGPDDYVTDLQRKWLAIYPVIVPEAIEHLISGKPLISQTGLEGTYYGRIAPEEMMINPDGSIVDAYNLIRALSFPYHGATIGGLIVDRAHMADNAEAAKCDGLSNGLHIGSPIGDILRFHDGVLIIDKKRNIS